jgi:hypothetical protein
MGNIILVKRISRAIAEVLIYKARTLQVKYQIHTSPVDITD